MGVCADSAGYAAMSLGLAGLLFFPAVLVGASLAAVIHFWA